MAEASTTLASPQIGATLAPSFVFAIAARRTTFAQGKPLQIMPSRAFVGRTARSISGGRSGTRVCREDPVALSPTVKPWPGLLPLSELAMSCS
jgi:hypothetical protein